MIRKVILFDPYGDAYGTGLATELAQLVNLFYITARNNTDKSNINGKIFYKFIVKPNMNGNKFFRIYKAFLLLKAHFKALFLIKKENVKILHMQWSQHYKIDSFFLKKYKKRGVKLIFTAHNVIPHINGNDHICRLNDLYAIFDCILVHGESLKNTFISFFPQHKGKIYVIKHGIYFGLTNKIDLNLLNTEEKELILSNKKIFIFFGGIFYSKGTDRLIRIWRNRSELANSVLIIAGGLDPRYKQMTEEIKYIDNCKNIIYKPYHVSEILLNTLLCYSDVVVMPYRNASMSGVVFKAASFKKPICSTSVGAIPEYLNNDYNFIVKNSFEDLEKEILNISNNLTKNDLKKKGEENFKYISKLCSWKHIVRELVEEIYEK